MKHKIIPILLLSSLLSACIETGDESSSGDSSSDSAASETYTGVPYDYSRYQDALDNANLQQNNPPGTTKQEVVSAGDYENFENEYFYIDENSGWLTFAMSGDGNRSELRFVENFHSNLTDTQYSLKANVLPINPATSVENSGDGQEITLLQVHNKGENGISDDTVLSHPLLRIVWDGENRTDDTTNETHDNAYWAIIKTNALECKNEDNPAYSANCGDSYDFYYLGDFDDNNATEFEISLYDQQLIINIDNHQKANIDISYWSHLYSYFKAGVYNQYENGNSIIQFETLTYSETDPNASVTDLPLADLDPSVAPSENFDLLTWYLGLPIDEDGNLSGDSDSIKEVELDAGYTHDDYFYTASDGGMVFIAPIEGAKTSANTKYTRTELREMLRRGDTSISTQGVNENNWVFSSAPTSEQNDAGGVDGILEATLAVNAVTTTGDSNQVGRVIIGQIHANSDEPIRLYYRLLPGHNKGSVYFAHEPNEDESSDSEVYIDVIGNKSSTSEPSDGIELNEKFFYQIQVLGNDLTLTLKRDDKDDIIKQLDMSSSGYDVTGQYMYFKAGVYNQNDSGDASDFVQATFYYLDNQHY